MFSENNFVGPEYYYYLDKNGLLPDFFISVGKFSEDQIQFELHRTGSMWKKREFPNNVEIIRFDSHKDINLWKFISENSIDLIIQGGVSFIFLSEMIKTVSLGVLNVHPGKLPEYRGCSAPEWAIYNGDDVYISAHMIDEGIDTGPIIEEQFFDYTKFDSYANFRANIYAECANVLVTALKILNDNNGLDVLTPQKDSNARYFERITSHELIIVQNKFSIIL